MIICLNVLAETTEVYNETEISEIEDFINKTVIIPEQAVPSGKEGNTAIKHPLCSTKGKSNIWSLNDSRSGSYFTAGSC